MEQRGASAKATVPERHFSSDALTLLIAGAEAAAAVVLAREAATKRVEAMQRDIEEATARKANIVWDSDWNKRNTVF
ncbi:unnamed protein product [Cladocopium goreaui]|uniref:Uncharacterized protein n=1 Tax=Cladocopium goreaui TaxID=2562237 RepID=A0A9P1FTS8_9DINO|nr:unnamed protein product [Cladocopium goreaui]